MSAGLTYNYSISSPMGTTILGDITLSHQPTLQLVTASHSGLGLATAALSADQVAQAISHAVEAAKCCVMGYSCTDSSMTQLIAHHLARELQALHPGFDYDRFMQRCNS